MHGGGNRIYRRHMIIHNGQFAECEVLKKISRTLWSKDKDKDLRSEDEDKDLMSKDKDL